MRDREGRQIAHQPQRRAAGMTGDAAGLATANRDFYDALWRGSRLVAPDRFNTWPVVRQLAAEGGQRLEIAPGLRPRLQVAGTFFVDISVQALVPLQRGGGLGVVASAAAIPLPDCGFRLLCAFDIIEHLEDDNAGFSELARLAMPGASLLLSVPLHPSRWSRFDDIVGHRRRYDPAQLSAQLRRHGFAVERSAAFGMRPRWSWLATAGMDLLARHPARGFWCYNNLLMPLALRRQKPLTFAAGIAASDAVDDLLLWCRKLA